MVKELIISYDKQEKILEQLSRLALKGKLPKSLTDEQRITLLHTYGYDDGWEFPLKAPTDRYRNQYTIKELKRAFAMAFNVAKVYVSKHKWLYAKYELSDGCIYLTGYHNEPDINLLGYLKNAANKEAAIKSKGKKAAELKIAELKKKYKIK